MVQPVRIKLDDPGITAADERAALAALRSGQLVSGPRVADLEGALAALTGRRHVVAVSSGTAALLAALEVLGIGPGSTVVVPALTFPAPAIAAAALGAAVRVCDVDSRTLNLSPRTIEPLLDESVSLVIAIDQFGVPAPIPQIERLLATRGIPLLVDAACSLGSSLDGQPCGSFGVVATFSFHPRKVLTTGEGGAVLTDDDALAGAVRRYCNIGMEDGRFRALGLNLRLPEVSAAIGLSQLDRLGDTVARRRELATRYHERLPLAFQDAPAGAVVNQQTCVALLPRDLGPGARDELIAHLAAAGIEAGLASYCLEALPWIAAELGIDPGEAPQAMQAHRRGIALPLHPGLAEGEVDEVARLVRNWLVERGAAE
jgi:perosamine synthetase